MIKRVLVADDHPLVRFGLKVSIKKHFPECEVDESGNGESTMAQLKSHHYDLVLLDLVMPDTDPSELLYWIRNFRRDTKILIVSMNNEGIYGRWALNLGANGYIEKDASPEELGRAVHIVIAGKRYISNDLSERLINDTLSGGSRNPFDELSPREFQIAMYIVQDYSISEISERLHVQYSTVKTSRRRIFEKLQISDRKALVQLAGVYNFV
jgi:two-component system, NarL family, invasion response regulator UvrY